jgi:hypothetical protein
MSSFPAARRTRPDWLVCSLRATLLFLGLLALVNLALPLASAIVAVAVLTVLSLLLLAVVLPALFVLGWLAETLFRRLGFHLPDPMRLRAGFRARVVSPLIYG